VLPELAESTLDGVALFIGGRVEGGWAAAPAATPQAAADLVRGLGDGGFDAASSQVNADRGAGVRLVAQDPPRPGPGTPGSPAGNLEPAYDRGEGQRVVALPGTGQPGQRAAPGVGEQVDFAGQPAPRAA